MASYAPPINILSIYNPYEYSINSTGLTIGTADLRYLKLSGGTLTGSLYTSGIVSITNTTQSTAYTNGAFLCAGGLGITKNVHINGDVHLSGAASTINVPNGTAALPSYSFTNDTDCGLYRIGANNIGWSVNGARVMDINASRLSLVCPNLTIEANGGFTNSIASATISNNQVISIPSTNTTDTFMCLAANGTITGTKYWNNNCLAINNSGATGLTLLNSSAGANTDTINFPALSGSSDTVVTLAASQAISNKTLTVTKFGTNGTNMSDIRRGTGTVTFSGDAQYAQKTTTISFSPSFAGTPQVWVCANNASAGQSSAVILQAGSITSSGATITGFYTFTSSFTGTVTFDYLAIY